MNKSKLNLLYHGDDLYAFALLLIYCSVDGFASKSDVETEKVSFVGICNMIELGFGKEFVVNSPRPPPIILDPDSTLTSFCLVWNEDRD